MRRGIVFIMVLGLLGTACGGDEETPTEQPAVEVPTDLETETPSPTETEAAPALGGSEAVLAAADAAVDVGSVRFSMDMTMDAPEAPEGSMQMSMSGAADYAAQYMNSEMTINAGGQQIGMRMILDDTVMYMSSPMFFPGGSGPEWLRMDLAAVGEQAGVDSGLFDLGAAQDPTATLQYLRGASDDIEIVGEETLNGTATTHYRGTVDLDKAVEQAPEEYRDSLEAMMTGEVGDTLPQSYPLDVWIDDDGLPRRMHMVLTLTPLGGGEITQTMTMDFFDYGIEVSKFIPSAGQVVDISDFATSPPEEPAA